MKKLLVVMISLVLAISLGACENASNPANLEERVETLESQVEELEAILIDLEVIEGLNGQKEYYLPQDTQSTFAQTVSASDIELMVGELDKTKAPSYVLDANEEYIPFADVAELLNDKYFGTDTVVTNALIGFQIKIVMNTNGISQEEFMAKIIMFINELALYDFYVIGGSELYIQTVFDGSAGIKVPVQTMRSSFITITPEVIYEGIYEVQLYGLNYDMAQVQTLYNTYMASGDYDGYVLDYKE